MKCPHCDHALEVVTTESHYGLPILLDQCRRCGGVWVDPDEVFRRSLSEAAALPLLRPPLRAQQDTDKKVMSCPRDGHALAPFKDPMWPKEIPIVSCGLCGGFWFSHRQLVHFDEYRRSLKKRKVEKDTIATQKEKDAIARINLMFQAQLAHPAEDFGATMLRFLSALPLASQTSLLANTIFTLLSHVLSRAANYADAAHQVKRQEKINNLMAAFDRALAERDTQNVQGKKAA